MNNIYNTTSEINDDNTIYKSFNDFIFSNDRKILHKLLCRYNLFKMVKNLPGDIVECGVFKGSGIFSWVKFIELHCPFQIKKVIGFDFFDQSFIENLDNEHDRNGMTQVFSRCNTTADQISDVIINEKLSKIGIPIHKYELIKGNISKTSKEYVKRNPGFRISLLYMDLDLEKPTIDTLENLWDYIVPGGVIVFDEYGYGVWTESNAVDTFIKKHNLTLKITNVCAPTAYIVKNVI